MTLGRFGWRGIYTYEKERHLEAPFHLSFAVLGALKGIAKTEIERLIA